MDTTLSNAPSFTGKPDRWSAWTPRASIRYDLNDNSNVYFTYSEGFKSGIYALATEPTAQPPVSPEKVNAYEVGYKMAQRTVSVSAAAYYYGYTNLQMTSQTNSCDASGKNCTLSSVTQNAKSAEIYGLELQTKYAVDSNVALQFGAAYTHARYKDFSGAPLYAPTYNAGGQLIALNQVVLPGGALPSANGKQMMRTPGFAANLTVNYHHVLFDGVFEASANIAYNDGFYWDAQNTLKQPSYTLLNGELSWSPSSGIYRLSIWAKNLTGEKYFQYAHVTSTDNAGVYGRPRAVGVAVDIFVE